MRAGRTRAWLAALGLLLLAAAFMAAVIASSNWSRAPRVDLTEDGLYTLAPGTVEIIHNVRAPIDLTLYFSQRATRDLPKLRSYEQRVAEMLHEMALRSQGSIHFKVVDPIPYSDDEDRAFGAGLTAMPGGSNGQRVFFGLAGRNARGVQLSIPFFDPNEESFLEYDIAKLLYELNMPHKPRVDILSSLPINGDAANGTPPWAVMRQLKQLFDIHMLDAGKLQHIDPETRTLLVIQPQHLPKSALFAIDQYVLHGGHLVVFVDPDAEMEASTNILTGGLGDNSSDLPRLFKAWGVQFNPHQVVLDRSLALPIVLPGGTRPVRHPAVLRLLARNLNHHDAITAGLHHVNVSSSGYFELAPDASSRLEPLIQTNADAMVVPARRVRLTVDPTMLLRDYQPSGEHYVIAARLRGTFDTAFPKRSGADDLHHAKKPNDIILVADTDILSNRMWVQPKPFLGRTLLSAFAGNGDFVANIVDYLSGSSALMSIRGSATSQRPFTRVVALRQAADQRFRAKEQELQQELDATEQRLTQLQPNATTAKDSTQRKELKRNLQRKLALRRQLRSVRHQLNAEIDTLGVRLQLIDILLIPLLLTLVGIGYGTWRIRRGRGRRRRR